MMAVIRVGTQNPASFIRKRKGKIPTCFPLWGDGYVIQRKQKSRTPFYPAPYSSDRPDSALAATWV